MLNHTYKVYVQTDFNGNIIAVNSSAFLADSAGWTQIDEGNGDKYHHAQGNYFNKPVMTEQRIYRYKLIDGKPAEKTDAEIAAEEKAITAAQEKQSQIATLQAQLTETDYKIIKCTESSLAGLDLPYDVATLHAERQAIRDQINTMESGAN